MHSNYNDISLGKREKVTDEGEKRKGKKKKKEEGNEVKKQLVSFLKLVLIHVSFFLWVGKELNSLSLSFTFYVLCNLIE